MSDPQLRCLLCDLLLADESKPDQPSETCKQCGRKVLAGQTGDEVPLQPLNPPPDPKPVSTALDELPEAVVVGNQPADDIPSVPVVGKARRADVPTVPPSGKVTTDPASVPYAARRSEPPAFPSAGKPAGKSPPLSSKKKVVIPDPTRVTDATPRPKVLQAFAVLGCMTVLFIIAIAILISCIVIGLIKASAMGN